MTPSKIYVVTDLSSMYDGNPAYGVEHIYEGIVSVWDDIDFAYQVCEDLELGIYDDAIAGYEQLI